MTAVERPFWRSRLDEAWAEAPIAWLSGVRRVGKTTLARSLGEERIVYVNCDLPVVEERLRDPELFYRGCERPVVVFDEIHQLRDPTRLLKIGADLFPHLRLLATGSSTLAASRKFKDTLTGRKRTVHLVPVLWEELAAFGVGSVDRRLHHGGLPEALLAREKRSALYREWLDSFYARDIQKLFAVRDVEKFNAFFEYLLKQSGGLLEVTRAGTALGISRPTVHSHLRALETTHAITLVRPFHGGGQKEVVKMPRCYGFDTGFVSFARGWDPLRPEDLGVLWEHVVLETLLAHLPTERICYWRDKGGREVDFVVPRGRDRVDAIECKWNPADFDPTAMTVFRRYYPNGANLVVAPLAGASFSRRFGALETTVLSPAELQ
ncbi:MAG: ATP-binding protein [candidate division NC10 bacterium]